jgi:lysozyme family protein
MYSKNFEKCFVGLVVNEGRYSNLPGDRGKRTWYGVSEKHHPEYFARMEAAGTDEERQQIARECYWDLYWAPMRCERVPLLVGFRLFDAAVVSGVGTATRCVQQACNIAIRSQQRGEQLEPDGDFGPITLSEVLRLARGWPRNLIGWTSHFLGRHFLGCEERHPGEYVDFLWGWGARLEEPECMHADLRSA